MMKPRVLVLKAAGVNCDRETAYAFEYAGAASNIVHVNELVLGGQRLEDYQILALSGGFTYGDDIAAGRILANELKAKLFQGLKDFIRQEKLIIGICNGFQVLAKAGLLPGNDTFTQEVTLAGNDSGFYEDRWTWLKAPQDFETVCVWTKGVRGLVYLPVAHAEGKFIVRDTQTLARLKSQRQIVFQYCDPSGFLSGYPHNPNGSVDNIAGICDTTGRVFGLMPHPERHLIGLHHPRWMREGLKEHGDGFRIFRNAVDFFQ